LDISSILPKKNRKQTSDAVHPARSFEKGDQADQTPPKARECFYTKGSYPRCDLIHVSLYDKPKYVALSYAWGDLRDTEMITIGQSSVPVTKYLYSALEHLRYNNEEVRTIWIDALCINQRDNDEKSWQVQLMREIYQRATSVTIWLGPAEGTSNEVMEFLRRLGTRAMCLGLDGSHDIRRKCY
jgi:hypothetical protein